MLLDRKGTNCFEYCQIIGINCTKKVMSGNTNKFQSKNMLVGIIVVQMRCI